MTKKSGTSTQQPSSKFSFTNRRLEQLKQPETGKTPNQIEYSDVVCIGLKLVHSCLTNRKVFHQRYYFFGMKKSIRIGEFPAVTVELAREITNANKALLAQGLDPAQERVKQSEKLTFKQFAEQIYLPDAMTRKRSWIDDKSKLEKDMYKAFGNQLLADISKGTISKYINGICNRTSQSTANRHRALLSSMMNMAIGHDLLDKNNVTHIPKFAESTEHGRSLLPEELKQLLTVLSAASKPVSALAIKLLLATGMRRSECLQLEWRSIDFNGCFAKLEMETTKCKRARNVILNPSAIAILKELERYKVPGNPYIFPGENGSHLTTVRKTFESSKKAAGIENFRLHDCRHTFCSILATSGASLYMIQKLVGHRSTAMTQRYSHLNEDVMQETSKIVSDQLGLALAI